MGELVVVVFVGEGDGPGGSAFVQGGVCVDGLGCFDDQVVVIIVDYAGGGGDGVGEREVEVYVGSQQTVGGVHKEEGQEYGQPIQKYLQSHGIRNVGKPVGFLVGYTCNLNHALYFKYHPNNYFLFTHTPTVYAS